MIGTVARIMSIIGKVIIGIGVLLFVVITVWTFTSGDMPIGNLVILGIFLGITTFILWGSTISIENMLWKFSDGLEDKSIPVKILAIIAAIPIGILWFILMLIISIFSKEKRGKTFSRRRVETVRKTGKIVEGSFGGTYDIVDSFSGQRWATIKPGSFGGTYDIVDSNGQKLGSIKPGSFGGTYDVIDADEQLKFTLGEGFVGPFNIWWDV